MKGQVTRAYIASCGMCGRQSRWSNVPQFCTKQYAEQAFRDDGWSKTAKHGWICPSCKRTNETTK